MLNSKDKLKSGASKARKKAYKKWLSSCKATDKVERLLKQAHKAQKQASKAWIDAQ